MEEEIWKQIPILDGVYYASSFGRIKRIVGKNCIKERIINGSISSTGYYTSVFSHNGTIKRYKFHRLVAMAFFGINEERKYVNHKNGIKTDNRPENLEWCTCSENNYHAYKFLGKKGSRHLLGVKYGMNPLSKKVIQYSKDMHFIKEWNSASEVEFYLNIYCTQISACCLMKKSYHTAGGFVWRFKDNPIILE